MSGATYITFESGISIFSGSCILTGILHETVFVACLSTENENEPAIIQHKQVTACLKDAVHYSETIGPTDSGSRVVMFGGLVRISNFLTLLYMNNILQLISQVPYINH